MHVFYRGACLTVLMTEAARSARAEAESRVPGNQRACVARVRALLQRLADRGRLRVPDEFRHEGDAIWAIRARCGLRAYGWFDRDRDERRVFIIGHYVLKKQNQARKADLKRAREARDALQGHNDGT